MGSNGTGVFYLYWSRQGYSIKIVISSMEKKRRNKEEKLSVLKEAENQGGGRSYDYAAWIYPYTFYRWRKA